MHDLISSVLIATVFVLVAGGCATDGGSGPIPATDLEKRIRRYAPTVITADLSRVPMSERFALAKIIEASRYMDEIFYRQAYARNPEIRAALESDTSREGRLRLLYFQIMKGPWDRQDAWRPFATEEPHPPGAGFYPEDMTVAEFEAACRESPERARRLRSLLTLVRRDEQGRLVAVPYREAFKEWLEPAARLLEGAAELTRNATLARFLRSRAEAFRTDDYYQSDMDWMDLDSQVEVTIGPYEVYEDELLNLKASYESFVTIVDPKESRALERYKAELEEMERNLPVPDEYKGERGRESPIRVAELVFASGEARKSVQTLAFNLPNDERVRRAKGAKKVLLANVIREKFNQIMIPIGRRVMAPDQLEHLSGEAFFTQTLFHELSHSMGPAYVGGDPTRKEVREALQEHYSALEEAKADVMGVCNVLYQIRKGTFPPGFRKQLLASYFVGLFRSIRFGLKEAHGRGAAVQINTCMQAGGALWNRRERRLEIDFDLLEKAVVELLVRILRLQYEGDVAGAAQLLEERAVLTPDIREVLDRVEDVPVDLRPIYPAAGEKP